MGLLAIDTDPEDFDIELAKLVETITEPTGFLRTPWGVILRIEVEDDLLAFEVAERALPPILIGRREVRSLRSNR
jgi:hypothetical protein